MDISSVGGKDAIHVAAGRLNSPETALKSSDSR
jgi:hypothetical protein